MEIHRFKHLIPQQKNNDNNDNNDNNNNNVTTNKPVREDGQDLGVMRHCCLELVLLAWVKSLCC
jgi:DNA-directed RNA polymerase subunit N (RpoN/RPB10)